MTVTRRFTSVAGVALMAALTSCGDAQKPADSSVPVRAPEPVAAKPDEVQKLTDIPKFQETPKFERAAYIALDGKSAITLVSPNELEFKQGDKTYSCQYSREGARIRAVLEVAGTKTIEYFNEVADGIQADNGTRYYAPLALEVARLQLKGDDLKRKQQELETKLAASKTPPPAARVDAPALPPKVAQPAYPPRPVPPPQHFAAQPVVLTMLPVEYVLQAEECLANNDRANAVKNYDKAVLLTENDGNPVQARIFAARRAAIEHGKR